MTQQRWPAVLGSAIAVLTPSHPAAGTLLKPDPGAGSKTMAMIVPHPPVPPEPKGSRGAAMATSDGDGLPVIWPNRPLLIGVGAIAKVKLIDTETGEEIWSPAVSPEAGWVVQAGPPLQPGRSYGWVLCDRDGLSLTEDVVTFPVLAAARRHPMTVALAEKEAALQAEQATAEAIALNRVAYFADQQRWVDGLIEALSIENSSAAMVEIILW
jgi:hypothetical protein